MADSGELDLSGLDGMDDIDWSDVEGELQKNKEMIIGEAESNPMVGMDSEDTSGATSEVPMDNEIATEFLMDIPLRLTVEVGRTTLMIKNLLELETGSIIELKKRIGAPMNVLINDKLVAKGEIVVQNEKFGIKLTEIIEESQRLLKLQES